MHSGRARSVMDILTGRPGDERPESLQQRLTRLAPPAVLTGVLLSLLIHLLLWLVAGLITVSGAQAGGAGPLASGVELAVVTEAELAQMQEAGLEAEVPVVPDVPASDLPEIALFDSAIADAAGLTEDIGDLSANLGAGDITGGSELGVGGAGGGAASFFGVEARGTRFAYIVDVSGSMGVGGKIEALKRELGKSITALTENAMFAIALYSTDAAILGGRHEWMEASDNGKGFARRAITQIQANGSTNPAPAFRLVFGLRPKPDAIYFMTDGEFSQDVALEIARLNADYRVPIHCIAFVSRDSEALMKQIAADSGGTYTFVQEAGK